LVERDAVANQPYGIGMDLVTLHRPAAADDVDDPRNAAERPLEIPVLKRLEVVEVVYFAAGRIDRTADRIAQDFTGWALRRQGWIDAVGQVVNELQPIDDFLAGLVEVDPVLELVPQV